LEQQETAAAHSKWLAGLASGAKPETIGQPDPAVGLGIGQVKLVAIHLFGVADSHVFGSAGLAGFKPTLAGVIPSQVK
jgi:hypothetical protein